MTRWKKAALGLFGVAVLIQAVPYGRDHDNPPVGVEPTWDAPETRALAVRACYDCHSNETKWPWYSHVAPVSWLVQKHVEDGRRHLNFSRFDEPQRHAGDTAEEVREGEMPMKGYVLLHSEAKLSEAEQAALIKGLVATFGEEKKGEHEKGENHEHH